MGDLYGAKWTESGQHEDGWTRELADIDLAAIAYAIGQSEKRYAEWPPTLAIFKSLCSEYHPPLGSQIGDLKKLYDKAPRDSEIARKHKGYIRAILGLPGGDKEGLREFLASPNVRMQR